MATLLHHFRPWMQKSIIEQELKMEAMIDQKVDVINEHFDSFELRVLERLSTTTYVSSFPDELSSLRADVDAILSKPAIESQAAPITLSDYTVLDALFSGYSEEEPEPTRAQGKRHQPRHIIKVTEEEKGKRHQPSHINKANKEEKTRKGNASWKREWKKEKQAKKDSTLDKHMRQLFVGPRVLCP